MCVHGVVIVEYADVECVDCERVAGPSETLVGAEMFSLRGIIYRINSKIDSDNAVASADSEQRVGVGAGGCQLTVAECVGITLTHILVVGEAVGVVLLYTAERKLFLE